MTNAFQLRQLTRSLRRIRTLGQTLNRMLFLGQVRFKGDNLRFLLTFFSLDSHLLTRDENVFHRFDHARRRI